MTLNILTAAKNLMLEELRAYFTLGGTIQVRTGAAPAAPSDAATGSLLLTYTLPAPAFAAAGSGTIAVLGAPLAAVATATGTPGYARFIDSLSAGIVDIAIGPAVPIADTNDGTDEWTTLVAHGLVANQAVMVYQGTVATGPAYVSVVDATTVQLLDAPGGSVTAAPPTGTYTAAYFRDARFSMSVSSSVGTVTIGDNVILPEFGVSI